MGRYYDLIMGASKESFTQQFNICWNSQIDQFPKPYADALQLRIGNHLRPKLTCWGAAFNTDNANEIDLKKTAEIASYIEMLHKASIIIDDMVDNDDARHGKKTFHTEFGRDKSIVFALFLLGKGMNGINEVFQKTLSHYRSMSVFSNTIYNMAIGCLEEMELDSTSRYDINKIRRIINLETISLIKNSLLLGYWSNCSDDCTTEDIIIEIGKNCGYVFQILNDIEPFASKEKNVAYKGGENIDINRDRKNIAVAYIYGAASSKEKDSLLKLSGQELQKLIVDLYNKYDIYEEVCADARSVEQQTYELIVKLQYLHKFPNCIEDFKTFVQEMINICFSKL